MKKYRLTDNFIEYEGRILYQIEALHNLPGCFFGENHESNEQLYSGDEELIDGQEYIKKGHLGGYIETENNLSHFGNCWVGGNAKVFGGARIIGNAYVNRNAMVYDQSIISDNSIVTGKAKITGNAMVSGESFISGQVMLFNNVRIYNSTLKDNVKIYNEVELYNADIGANAEILSSNNVVSVSYHEGINRIRFSIYVSNNSLHISYKEANGNYTNTALLNDFIYRLNKEQSREYKIYFELIKIAVEKFN